MFMDHLEPAIGTGGLAVVLAMLAAGFFVGLTPGAYLAGPAVLGYLNVGASGGRGALVCRALAHVVGAALPMAALGVLLGLFGDVALAIVAEQVVAWYLLVALVCGVMGLLLTGLLVVPLPSYLPIPRPAASGRDAFLLGLPLGLAACPACTPMLFPIATAATLSGGPLYGGLLLLLFGIGRGIPVLVAAASLETLRRLRGLIPVGLAAQRLAGWLLLALSGLYLLQGLLVLAGWPALFA